MAKMSTEEIVRFLMQGTFTGKLATTRRDRGSHVVPIWFVLDNKSSSRDEMKILCLSYMINQSKQKISKKIIG